MSNIKKQHYVPQFYLRNFARNDQLFVFDKFSKRSFRANVKDVSSEAYFYDVSEEYVEGLKKFFVETEGNNYTTDEVQEITQSMEIQMVEKYLSKIENRFANVLKKVLKALDNQQEFKTQFVPDIAEYTVIQFFRTLEQLKIQIELFQKMKEDLNLGFDSNRVKLLHNLSLIDPDRVTDISRLLQNHIWFIGVNNTQFPLYTSDSPVVLQSHQSDRSKQILGLAAEGIEIAFPLSSRYVVILRERNYFEATTSVIFDRKIIHLNYQNVVYYNSLQVKQSYRQVYCFENTFDLALEICNRKTEVSDPNRQRLIRRTLRDG